MRRIALILGGLVFLGPLGPSTDGVRAESRATLVPASGSPGAPATLAGAGFGKRDRVTVRIGGQMVATSRTGRRGSFRTSVTIPGSGAKRLRVVTRSGGRRVVNNFRLAGAEVLPESEVAARRGRRVRWTFAPGAGAGVLRVAGSRFPARRRIRIRMGGGQVARLRTDRSGRFSAQITVPPSAVGRRLVRIKVGERALGFLLEIRASDFGPAGGSGSGADARVPSGPTTDPVIAAAGDIACDPGMSGFKNGLGESSRCRQQSTSDLLVNAGYSAVLALGDIQYECAAAAAFSRSYGPSWGRVKAITRPAAGNHEYRTSGGTGCDTSGKGGGYFGYFGAAAGNPATGYYSFDLGAWHLVALNSNCSVVSCSSSSAQVRWLRQDLAAHPARCTLGYWHHPRFTSGTNSPGSNSVTPLYQALYDHGADVVLVGHDHDYERFAPQNPSGGRDLARGIRQFVVGTGGRGFHPLSTPRPNSEVRQNSTFGILRMALHATGYDWEFVPEAGRSFRDSGSQACH
jgi:hypothetical protein